MKNVLTTCPWCGCGMYLKTDETRPGYSEITGDPQKNPRYNTGKMHKMRHLL
ncbi:MAG: hypothetical protein AB1633_02125 [Elusimicrobiota bacterium]